MTLTTPVTPILIVEDSDEDFDTVLDAIRQSGVAVEVRRALTGGECLNLLHESVDLRPAVVLMDLNTPGIDGREALVAIKSDHSLSAFPVVVLSTSDNPRDLLYCYQSGANAYHVKPVRYPDHIKLLVELLQYWIGAVVLPESKRAAHEF